MSRKKCTLTEAFAAVARVYDVLVLGGGVAGLCAALAASEAGARVALLEKAQRPAGSGNSRHASRMLLPGRAAGTEDFIELLHDGRAGEVNAVYAAALAGEAAGYGAWLAARGVPLPGADSRLPGGGKAFVLSLYAAALEAGVAIGHGAAVSRLAAERGEVCGASFFLNGAEQTVRARSVVAACGGMSPETGERSVLLGSAANNGALMAMLESCVGHRPVLSGGPDRVLHVPVDGRAPAADGGDVVSVDMDLLRRAVVTGEGGTVLPPRADASAWGALLEKESGGRALAFFDASLGEALSPCFPPLEITDASLDPAEVRAGLPALGNARVPRVIPLAAAAYCVVYGPVLDGRGAVRFDGPPLAGLFAAGEAVFSNIPAVAPHAREKGSGFTAAALSGLLAGRSAAAFALQRHVTEEAPHDGN